MPGILSHVTRIAIKARYILLIGWGLAWLPHARTRSGPRTDWGLFVYAGRALTDHPAHYSGGPLHLYVEIPGLQLGAAPLLLTRLFDLPFGLASGTAATVFTAALAACVIWVLDLTAKAVTGRSRPAVAFLAGLVVVPAWVEGVGAFGHLDDVVTLTALTAAVLGLARRWPAWTVGALLGFAVACKPWALAIVPILLVLPRRKRPESMLAFITAVAVCWLPFILAAPGTLHALASLRLPVMTSSALHALGLTTGSPAPGWVRPAQLLVGVAVAGVMVRRGMWLAAPLAGIAARVMLDPAAWGYYGMGPVLAAALYDIAGTRRHFPWWTVTAAAVEYVPWPPAVAGWLRLAWAVGTLTTLLVLAHRTTVAQPSEVQTT